MSISLEEVRKVAALAKLHFSDREAQEMARKLSIILDYVDQLSKVDTAGVEPMSHAIAGENIFRNDIATSRINRAQVLVNAPDADADYFRVPKVIRQT